MLYNHLSTLSFYDGDYDSALANAQLQHGIWADNFGDQSPEAVLNDLHLGIALLGRTGRPRPSL